MMSTVVNRWDDNMASVRKRTWKSGGETRTAWVVDYFDQAHKRHIKTFQKKKDADAFKIKSGHEIQIGTHTPSSMSKTVAEAAEIWITRAELNELARVGARHLPVVSFVWRRQ